MCLTFLLGLGQFLRATRSIRLLARTYMEQKVCILAVSHFVLLTDQAFSGKTALIHSLAGKLGLDIYVVSLSSKG